MNRHSCILAVLVLASAIVLVFPAHAVVNTSTAVVNTSWMTAHSEICVRFNGTNTGAGAIAESVWFAYGNNVTGYKSFKTKNQTVLGQFNTTVCGFPWLPGETFDITAVSSNNTGNNVQVVIPTITPHPTTTYEDLVDRFIEAGDDPKTMIHITWEPYTTVMGGLFFGIVTIGVFSNIAIKQRTVFVALLLSILMGGTIWGLFTDEPAIVEMAQIIITAGMIGLLYFLFTKRT